MYSAYNYYTKVKGRKFQIPFFDDDFLSSQFAPSSVNWEENYELEKEQDFENIYGKPQLTVSLDITKFFDIFDFYITFSIILTNKVCANINDIKHKLYVEFYYVAFLINNTK